MLPASLTEGPHAVLGPRRLRLILIYLLIIFSGLGLAAELVHQFFPSSLSPNGLAFLSLSYEANLPTWYATCLLFVAGLLLAAIASVAFQYKVKDRHHWAILSILFFYISLDEAVGLHENLSGLLAWGGIWYFDWVIPAVLIILIIGAFYLPFIFRLPTKTRNRFILAGAVYIGGALFMELPLGYWTEQHGSDNLIYALIDWFEEFLELLGISIFLVALWEYFPPIEAPKSIRCKP